MSLRLLFVAMFLTTAAALGMIAYRAAQPPQVMMQPLASTPALAPLTVGYLAAARSLPAGTLARDEDFVIKNVAPAQLPAGAIENGPEVLASVRGALIRRYIDAGAPVAPDDILRLRERGFLAAVLAPGTRAVSVGVDAVTGVAGLIWPGDRVDVILTQQMDQATAPITRRILSETVLRDLRVIAVDQEIVQGATPGGAAGKPARTVTLQVSETEAEHLAVAVLLGRISLSIRAMVAAPDAEAAGTGQAVFSADVSPTLRGAGDTGGRVQVIQGDKRDEVKFQ